MKNILKFGILGCGMIADIHAKAINSLENAELIGVADNNIESAKLLADKYGVKAFNDYNEMLNSAEIDAVCICTPSGFHADNAITALNAGKNVVLEKPMAISIEDAERVISACNKTDKKLTVISQLRFSEDVIKLKELIEQNAFGTLVFCDLSMKYWRDPQYYATSNWKGTFKFDGGGALMNQGIHGVDLLLYIAGNAKLLNAKVKTSFHKIEVEDTAVATIQFENGALGTIKASTCTYPGFERKIEILGSNGCAVLRENKFEKLVVNGETVVNEINVTQHNTANDPAAVQYEAHAKQINNFINAVLCNEDLLIDEFEGQKAVKLIEEIYNFK